MITAVILAYRRFEHLEEVIQSWLDQDEVTEVIVCDNSGTQWKTDLPITVLNSNKNYGTYFRYAAPLLAENKLICWGDDDLLIEKGLMRDLLDLWSDDKLVGIMGKNFTGKTYYTATGYRGKNIKKPTQVDYLCGLCILGHKNNFVGFDPMSIRTKFFSGKQLFVMGDWWWEHWLQERNKDMTFWVAPTDKYEQLRESTDTNALHRGDEFQEVREYYFRKWVLGTEKREINEIHNRFSK